MCRVNVGVVADVRGEPFERDGSWLRCALHAHTTRSDGELSPDELVRLYDDAGFDVLAITAHWSACRVGDRAELVT